jgi:hypothetical protein
MYRLQGQTTTSLNNINNGTLSSMHAMPSKDLTSDGTSTFAMGRQQYIRAYYNTTGAKQWYGNSSNRDSSSVMQRRVYNEIGNGTLNASKQPMSFTEQKVVNTTRDALRRVRNSGSAAPAKKIYKNMNTGAF